MLLDERTVAPYLVARGIFADDGGLRVRALGGGVSNVVLLVDGPGRRVVVKQALGRLRVAEEWTAPVGRVLTEARALGFAADVIPGRVPDVLDTDPSATAMTMVAAPATWPAWKDLLLGGVIDPAIGAALGGMLARLHATTPPPWLDEWSAFEALRVEPYHRAVSARLPEAAARVGELVEAMWRARRCFVHGDYSPKNVLVGDETLWLIDFEVAHLGDPAFDVAFLLNHLVLKSVRRPADRPALRRCAEAFGEAYARGCGNPVAGRHLVAHLACLLAARVVGKSPAEYLDAESGRRVVAVALRALAERPEEVDWVWDAFDKEAR